MSQQLPSSILRHCPGLGCYFPSFLVYILSPTAVYFPLVISDNISAWPLKAYVAQNGEQNFELRPISSTNRENPVFLN
jgi:hypothetical protein